VCGRYVRIEIRRNTYLQLGQVEVYSAGKNIAYNRNSSQINTDGKGLASNAIDGNTCGDYRLHFGSHTCQCHHPWWEVDLGDERPIELIVIYNRTDQNCGKRLDGFTLKVLDSSRATVFERNNQPAPEVSIAFKCDQEPVQAAL